MQQLSDACLVVDALEPSVREELVKNFCSKELISYKQIFDGAGQNLYMLHTSVVYFTLLQMCVHVAPLLF